MKEKEEKEGGRERGREGRKKDHGVNPALKPANTHGSCSPALIFHLHVHIRSNPPSFSTFLPEKVQHPDEGSFIPKSSHQPMAAPLTNLGINAS